MVRKRSEQGAALVTVLLVAVCIAIVATVLMSSLSLLRNARRHSWQSADCALAARAGIEHAVWELSRDSAAKSVSGTIGRGQYGVVVRAVPGEPELREVTSKGSLAEPSESPITRVLRAHLRVGPRVEIVQWLRVAFPADQGKAAQKPGS